MSNSQSACAEQDAAPLFGSTSRILAWRFFTGRERNALVSFISAVSITGLSIAIALLILVLSVMNGFEKEFRERILGLAPHATLWFDQPQSDWPQVVEQLNSYADITRAEPFVEFKAMAVVANQVRPLLVQGVNYNSFSELIKPYLSVSTKLTLEQGDILLGAALAQQLNIAVGDNIRLMVPRLSKSGQTAAGANTLTQRPSGQAKTYTFRVADILSTGTEIDNALGLVGLADAAAIKHTANAVQGLQIQVSDLFEARSIAMRAVINHELQAYISDWTQSFGNLYTAIQLSRQLVGLLLTSIIGVAVFNIFVTLGMVVRNKQREIAILRTMGLSRRGVMVSFMLQGMMISILGCVIGVLLGSLLALSAPLLVSSLEQLLGIAFLQTDVYPINYLPSEIKLTDIAVVTFAALLMSLVATLYPAWRAAKILPAAALRSL